ncbi:hypothetical protein J5N97_014810 [Dioscorea zingiberensis]|uniref:Uncharacterized protein n=1 Tax=Dioscorea zingiberensis TaxID=325984 RepID=A0A9D5HK24_9LILI|nr:hypothetical protein J5N97_014810 [Dioscorea zingiberensis]
MDPLCFIAASLLSIFLLFSPNSIRQSKSFGLDGIRALSPIFRLVRSQESEEMKSPSSLKSISAHHYLYLLSVEKGKEN